MRPIRDTEETREAQRGLRAYRYALDPTDTQAADLGRHAGTARWAYNNALSAKVVAHDIRKTKIAARVAEGVDEATARKEVKVRIPGSNVIDKARVKVRGTDAQGRPARPDWAAALDVLLTDVIDQETAAAILTSWAEHVRKRGADPTAGIQPWAPTVPNPVVQRAQKDADRAWKNWMDSLTGKRKGKRVGFPRFKKLGRARDSFYLANTYVTRVTDRRIRLGGILGEIRTHSTMKRLRKALDRRAGRVMSATVSRGGHRWYVSVLVEEDVRQAQATHAQRAAGTVGVDLGVKATAALSTGEIIPNPRTKRAHANALTKASRGYARTEPNSKRRSRAARRLGRLQALEAARRATIAHALTKRLTTCWARVAIEDLNVAGMTRSSRGTAAKPGKRVRQKAGLSREILDVAPGEIRRQLTYKAPWYGSEVAVLDRFFPSSKMCSACGSVKPKLSLSERSYHCTACGHVQDRDVNAARNIARHAVPVPVVAAVASGRGETRNGRGGLVSPGRPRSTGRGPVMCQDQAAPAVGPPRSSDAALTPISA